MFKKNQLSAAVLAAVAASAAQNTYAQIEEILVTATKREASTQDIPVAVQALSAETLEQAGIATFDDYLLQMPGITAGGSGPGQSTIYIRGVASTTPTLSVAGVAGLAPNVSFYLDEQPLAQPGRNLDIYAADLARIEVLSGPQGTLFGTSSQAGAVRLITNKPDPNDTYSRVKLGGGAISDGGNSHNFEAMFNLPVSERATLRAVGYVDKQGGWIDNVFGEEDLQGSARFRPEGTQRPNGVPVQSHRAGLQADGDPDDLANAEPGDVTFQLADNTALLQEDFNETTYTGGRISLLYDFNIDWRLNLSHTEQMVESDGVFFADPNLDDYQIQRYEEDALEDQLSNTNWVLEGRLGNLDMIYAGAYTDREAEQTVDYTDYLFSAQYLPYYICDFSVVYPGASMTPAGTCYSPAISFDSYTTLEVTTHELRFVTDASYAVRGTFGAFFSDTEITERNDFVYPGITNLTAPDTSLATPFAPNRPFMTGYFSRPGPFPETAVFRNDILRTDENYGIYGEMNWDITPNLTLTLGGRYYDIEVDMEGSANTSFCNYNTDVDANAFGTDISDLYNGDGLYTYINSCTADNRRTYTLDASRADSDPNLYHPDSILNSFNGGPVEADTTILDLAEREADRMARETARLASAEAAQLLVVGALAAPDVAIADGFVSKVSLSYAVSENALLYFSRSEGFRPGLLNRPGGRLNRDGSYSVPFTVDTDDITNYEIGWKTDLRNRFRFNGNIFLAEIENLQTTIFDPNIVNLFFSDNAADAEVRGVEGELTWLPTDALTISGAFSVLDSEITRVITPTNDVRKGDELAYAPGFQTNLSFRYEWGMGGGLTAHVMPHLSHSDKSYSDIITINRDEIDGWTLFGLTAGIRSESWNAELYIDNLTDELAERSRNLGQDVERVTYAQPRTIGLRVSFDF
ncbi:MAG: TonB-dependent receptor [Pseudohongiellaceae bacterium]